MQLRLSACSHCARVMSGNRSMKYQPRLLTKTCNTGVCSATSAIRPSRPSACDRSACTQTASPPAAANLGLQRLGTFLAGVVVDEHAVPPASQMPRHSPTQPLRPGRHQGIALTHGFQFPVLSFLVLRADDGEPKTRNEELERCTSRTSDPSKPTASHGGHQTVWRRIPNLEKPVMIWECVRCGQSRFMDWRVTDWQYVHCRVCRRRTEGALVQDAAGAATQMGLLGLRLAVRHRHRAIAGRATAALTACAGARAC